MIRLAVSLALLLPVVSVWAGGSPPLSDAWRVQAPRLFAPAEPCCFDFSGNGQPDDRLGAYFASLAISGGDAQAVLDQAVADGALSWFFVWSGTPATQADLVPGQVVSGVRSDGSGVALLDPAGYPGSGPGLFSLTAGSADGPFGATLDGFQVPFPVGTEVLLVEAELALAEGVFAVDGPGCAGRCTVDPFHSGTNPSVGGLRLGAVVPGMTLFGTLDARYRTCTCAGLDPDQPVLLFAEGPGSFTLACSGNTGEPANCAGIDEVCAGLDNFCAFTPILVGLLLDLDRNGNGVNESMSAGLRLSLAGSTPVETPIFANGFEAPPPP